MSTGEAGPEVLYILGAGHCGSTLLGLLLNGHPAMVAVSEVNKLAHAIASRDPVLAQPGWLATRVCYEAQTGAAFNDLNFGFPGMATLLSWDAARVRAWATPLAAMMRSMLDATGKALIVDGSKSVQPLYLMHRSGLFRLRVLHLVRDGRAIVHSYQTKYGGVSVGVKRWAKPSLAAVLLRRRFTGSWLEVKYEELASEPEQTLRTICEFVDQRYGAEMLRYRSHEWMGIGGNRLSKRADDTIHLDESWRRDMRPAVRVGFDVLCGALNRYYGYR